MVYSYIFSPFSHAAAQGRRETISIITGGKSKKTEGNCDDLCLLLAKQGNYGPNETRPGLMLTHTT